MPVPERPERLCACVECQQQCSAVFSSVQQCSAVFKSSTNASDGRIKENEQLIESVCETLSKLRPQVCDIKTRKNKVGLCACSRRLVR